MLLNKFDSPLQDLISLYFKAHQNYSYWYVFVSISTNTFHQNHLAEDIRTSASAQGHCVVP